MAWPDSGLDAIGRELGAKTASQLAEAQRYAIRAIEQVIFSSATLLTAPHARALTPDRDCQIGACLLSSSSWFGDCPEAANAGR